MPRRRRSRFAAPAPRAGSPFLTGTPARRHGPRRRRRGGPSFGGIARLVAVLALLGAIAAGVVVWRSHQNALEARRDAAVAFLRAWERGDTKAMYATLTAKARRERSAGAFARSYRRVDRAATVKAVDVGRIGDERDDRVRARVAVATTDFGTLTGTVAVPVAGSGDDAGVAWDPALRLPGLRRGEAVRRRSGDQPARASVLAADGTRLASTPLGAEIAGEAGERPTGLERMFDERLSGHPAGRLQFGERVVARTKAVRGRSVRTTLRPGLMRTASAALGGKVGGVAVLRPRDGAVLAVAGLAVSAPQPPGSTFKIITTAAALEHGVAKPSTRFPVQTSATLSGVKLGNAGGESCGGTLTASFIESCNSVFAPLGAKVGAKRLVAMAKAFGFGERPPIPALKPSTMSSPSELRDAIAIGSAAIGQERDLATPLEMATVAATIGAGGVRARPRLTELTPVVRKRVVKARVARQVREMMVGVVQSGTGTSAAIPGVQVAGKTGTAELRPNSKDPKDADAWFVAFAPARKPKVAIAVMVVGAGFGGTAAAPVARRVLRAAL